MQALVVIFFGLPAMIVIRSWAIGVLFNWFFVPFGLDPIGFGHAFGLSCFVTLFTYTLAKEEHEDEESFDPIVRNVVAHVFFVSMGWIAHMFM